MAANEAGPGGIVSRVLGSVWGEMLRRSGQLGLPIVAGVALGAAGAAFPPTRDAAVATIENLYEAAAARPELRLRIIELRGGTRVTALDAARAMGLVDAEGRPIEEAARALTTLSLDARAAREAVERLGWVKSARVAARPPQTLEIEVVERTPALLWRVEGTLRLLDGGGAEIERPAARAAYAALPLLVGPGARGALAEGLALDLAARRAGLSPAALERIGRRRWDMALASGVRVMLPEHAPLAAIETVARWAAREDLLTREISVVDLRVPEAPTVRLAPPSRAETFATLPTERAGRRAL